MWRQTRVRELKESYQPFQGDLEAWKGLINHRMSASAPWEGPAELKKVSNRFSISLLPLSISLYVRIHIFSATVQLVHQLFSPN